MKYAPIEIRCPGCGKRAEFHEPFEFVSQREASDDRKSHRWGGWRVIELFPNVFRWQSPKTSSQHLRRGGGSGGYAVLHHGMVRCPACHGNGKHVLEWPRDAYWAWDIRGETLWAWDTGHARRILDYVGRVRRFRPATRDLRKIPKAFLSAKVRDLVVKRIRESFAEIGESPDLAK